MLLRKKWIVVFLCSLALLIAFSTSTEPAHAASMISHEQSNTSIRPHGGPPGCNDLVFLNVSSSNPITYQGHKFIVEEQLLGWYTTLENGTQVFCDQIMCQSSVYPTNSTVPPGYLGIICGEGSTEVTKTERIAGGGGITSMAVTVSASGSVASCAEYRPYGGSINYAGWGCQGGWETYPVPSEIF